MSYAGRFDHLLAACLTPAQCIELANLVSLAVMSLRTLPTTDGRHAWLTDLTGLAFELGARTALLETQPK